LARRKGSDFAGPNRYCWVKKYINGPFAALRGFFNFYSFRGQSDTIRPRPLCSPGAPRKKRPAFDVFTGAGDYSGESGVCARRRNPVFLKTNAKASAILN
jgi:hypothetical protein